MSEAMAQAHEVVLNHREKMTVTGVSEVNCFNEQMIVLSTSEGMLTVAGENLFIAQLSLEEGRASIEGKIASLEYEERPQKPGAGWLRRIFR